MQQEGSPISKENGGDVELDISNIGDTFGKSIEVLRAKFKALREQGSTQPSPDLLTDQGGETGRDVAEQGKTERASALSTLEMSTPLHPTTVPEPMPTRMASSKPPWNIWDRVIGNGPRPLYQGCEEGERSELNDPVLFFDCIERCYAFSDTGVYRLPVDQLVEREGWAIIPKQYSGRRRDLLIELIATHLGTHQLFFSPTSITVYRITGERDQVPPKQVKATGSLRSLVAEEAANPQARTITKNALDRMVWGPKETIAAAASR